jgi:hypothetical protein
MAKWVRDGGENADNWPENAGIASGEPAWPNGVLVGSTNFVPEPGFAGIFVLTVWATLFHRRQKFPEIFPCVGGPVPNIFRVAE